MQNGLKMSNAGTKVDRELALRFENDIEDRVHSNSLTTLRDCLLRLSPNDPPTRTCFPAPA